MVRLLKYLALRLVVIQQKSLLYNEEPMRVLVGTHSLLILIFS